MISIGLCFKKVPYTPAEPEATLVTLTFDANGGSVTTSTIKQSPNSSITLPTPTRSGYTFDGWYTALSGGTKVTYTKMPSASKTLYARWTSVWTGTKATSFARGSGTSSDPYIIETAAQLAYFQSQVNDNNVTYSGKYIKMVNNIDLNNKSWSSIGKGTKSGTGSGSTYIFSGNFDGGENVIYNLKPDGNMYYIGLFGRVLDCTIQNLTIASGSITVPSDNGNSSSGAVIGYAVNVTVKNCINKINVAGEGGECGGIIGQINGSTTTRGSKVSDCINYGKISGYGVHTGGIIGKSTDILEIKNCHNYATVTTNGSNYAGGVVGYQTTKKITMERCGNEGTVSGASNVAGIVGAVDGSELNTITQCYNKGDITASSNYASGILGSLAGDTTISYCYNTGAIKATVNNAAGIAANAGTIKNCYSTGIITAPNYSCGIASRYTSSHTYSNNYYLSGSARYALYNKASAAGYMSKSSSELSASSIVTTLNNGSTVYKAVSGGYPVFTWQ